MKKPIMVLCFVFSIFLGLFYASCDKREECDTPVGDAYFTFRLVDEFGVMQIAAWGHRYLSDSVFMTKMDGSSPTRFIKNGGGDLGLAIHEDDKEADEAPVTRHFLLHLPDTEGKPYHDTDTISFTYKFNNYCFENFVVKYNGEIQHEGKFEFFMFLVKK